MTLIPVIFKLAISTLVENRLRSGLTLLGMIFGTAAVIATLSSNDGAKKYIASQLESLGTKLITAQSSSLAITDDDALIIEKYSEEVESVVREQALGNRIYQRSSKSVQLGTIAADDRYFNAMGLKVDEGRNFVEPEYNTPDFVALVGQQAKNQLFGKDGSFINEHVEIVVPGGHILLKIIGNFKEKGGANANLDSSIFVTPALARKIFPEAPSARLVVLLKNDENSGLVKKQMSVLLSPRFGSSLNVVDAREAIDRTKSIWEKQNLVGICLAIVSLLTGGVGIMNIMILSIAQRQKEIGLRKAVGARNREIAYQFLFEAIVICLAGGVLGVFAGWGFGQQVAKMLGEWQAETSWQTIAIALSFAALTGLVFGLIPALKAASLDPYDALRTG